MMIVELEKGIPASGQDDKKIVMTAEETCILALILNAQSNSQQSNNPTIQQSNNLTIRCADRIVGLLDCYGLFFLAGFFS